jgi:hypothetical protein
MSGQPSRLRALLAEIVEAHTLWPQRPALAGRDDFIKEHIRRLFRHPNACGRAWDQWSRTMGCPLVESVLKGQGTDESAKKKAGQLKAAGGKIDRNGRGITCLDLARKLSRSIARIEAMAAKEGAGPLLTTFDLLYTLSGGGAAHREQRSDRTAETTNP